MTAAAFEYFRRLVVERAGIVLDPGKEYLIESRLGPVARSQGFGSLDELASCLAGSGQGPLHRQVVEAIATNETAWFRDAHPFEAIRNAVLPGLIEARAAERRLDIWSAAASTGQEAYTLALTIREFFPTLREWTISILGTDLATDMLDRARIGRYSQLEITRGLPAPLLVKYFRRDGPDWVIRDEIRAMVEFRELNLAEQWPVLPPMDLVLMRNVLIYFDIELKKASLRRVRQVLRPDGYLLLGGAETMLALDDTFEREPVERAVFYRLNGAGTGRECVGV